MLSSRAAGASDEMLPGLRSLAGGSPSRRAALLDRLPSRIVRRPNCSTGRGDGTSRLFGGSPPGGRRVQNAP